METQTWKQTGAGWSSNKILFDCSHITYSDSMREWTSRYTHTPTCTHAHECTHTSEWWGHILGLRNDLYLNLVVTPGGISGCLLISAFCWHFPLISLWMPLFIEQMVFKPDSSTLWEHAEGLHSETVLAEEKRRGFRIRHMCKNKKKKIQFNWWGSEFEKC